MEEQVGNQVKQTLTSVNIGQVQTTPVATEIHVDTRPHGHPTLQLWVRIIIFSILVFGLVIGYLYLTGGYGFLIVANQAAGETGLLVMGLSMALSGLSYFWNFADRFIQYRRYLGVVGFGFALYHGLYSFANYFISENGGARFDLFYNFPVLGTMVSNIWAFSFGLTALLIFAGMAAVSNNQGMRLLGKWW